MVIGHYYYPVLLSIKTKERETKPTMEKVFDSRIPLIIDLVQRPFKVFCGYF